MSRTTRKNRKTNKSVPDGKHPYKCKCEWCRNIKRKKHKEKAFISQVEEQHYCIKCNSLMYEYEDKEWLKEGEDVFKCPICDGTEV